ncbi:hypothetical protein [Streptomyces sp. Caat 7-52]|uniref:WD40 repeat domain-containing protein n=1 Tax=Streptomyces sp. Caat 7-52 TaxID=2949637 RepID=UPI002035748B|nr:hypothetical protein [Streptomyces sp. Caat 7-52]
MSGMIDYGSFAERLRSVMPRWDDRERMSPDEFAAHLADTAPRWELLRRFQEEWGYEVPDDAVPWQRWSESEHRQYLRRLKGEAQGDEGDDDPFESVDLSLPIPSALDEWWELPYNSFTHSPRLYWTNPEYPPTLRPDPGGYGVAGGLPDDTTLVPAGADRRMCVFKAEYEYCNEWGYPAAEAGLPDPRVLVSVAEEEWALQAGSLSEFFLQLAVQRLPSYYGWTVYGGDETERIVAWVKEELPTLGLRPWRELGQHITVYGAPDALVFHDTGYGDFELTVYGRTTEALLTLGARMGLDWSDRIHTPRSVQEAPKPIALAPGDTDEFGRWTVLTTSPDPMASGTERSSANDGTDSWTVSGTLAVTCDEDGTLRVRRLDGDAAPVTAHPQAGPATALACLDVPGQGPLIASGHRNGTLYVWLPDSDDGPLEVARQRPKLSGLALTATADGTVLAACWRDDVVALWDIASGERADLDLGPGITGVRLDADLRLTVGGPSGSAVVRLDADALWPARELMLSVVSFEDAACATDTDPEVVPRRLAELLSWDADDARHAVAELDTLLAPESELCSAAALAFVYLTQIGAAVGVGAPHCHVRRRALGLALRIIRAVDAGGGRWHEVTREVLDGIRHVLPDMMEEEDPATRTAGALLVAARGEPDERAGVLLRALAADDTVVEVSAAAALALGDAGAVDTLVSAGWERADVDWLLPGQ